MNAHFIKVPAVSGAEIRINTDHIISYFADPADDNAVWVNISGNDRHLELKISVSEFDALVQGEEDTF